MSDNPKDALSTAELVRDLSEGVSRLVRDELRLARIELTEKGKHAGIGVGLFGGAGLVAFYGGAALVAAVILLLALTLPAWVAALLVGIALLAVGGLLGLLGKKQVTRAAPPMPEETVRSVKADVDAVKDSIGKERTHR